MQLALHAAPLGWLTMRRWELNSHSRFARRFISSNLCSLSCRVQQGITINLVQKTGIISSLVNLFSMRHYTFVILKCHFMHVEALHIRRMADTESLRNVFVVYTNVVCYKNKSEIIQQKRHGFILFVTDSNTLIAQKKEILIGWINFPNHLCYLFPMWSKKKECWFQPEINMMNSFINELLLWRIFCMITQDCKYVRSISQKMRIAWSRPIPFLYYASPFRQTRCKPEANNNIVPHHLNKNLPKTRLPPPPSSHPHLSIQSWRTHEIWRGLWSKINSVTLELNKTSSNGASPFTDHKACSHERDIWKLIML